MRFSFLRHSISFLLLAIVLQSRLLCAQLLEIHVLDTLGGSDSYAHGINNKGQVVGEAFEPNGNKHAVIWDDPQNSSTPRDLEFISGGSFSNAYKINNAGQIVGLSDNGKGIRHAAYWDAGGIIDIGTLGGDGSFANDISESGIVVGSADLGPVNSHAFTWTKSGGIVDHGNLNPVYRFANAGFNGINSSGVLVGTAYDLFSPYRSIAQYPGDKDLTDISVPGRSNSMALAVNDSGTIVGFSSTGNGTERAVIFDGQGGFTDLGALDLTDSWAQDINNHGDIVGYAFALDAGEAKFRAFLYRNGEMIDLTSLLPKDSGWSFLSRADAINDLGQIVGVGVYAGEVRGFVLNTIVPEPAVVVPALGLILMFLSKRSIQRNH